jgi:hypothetical protein
MSFLLRVYILLCTVCFTPMRFPRVKAEGQSFCHCVSRVVDRNSFSWVSELFWPSQMASPGKKSAGSIATTSLCTEAPKTSSQPLTWPQLKGR